MNKLTIPILTFGVFGIITTEMGVIGLLPYIMQEYRVDATKAGYLMSAFALIVAIGGPAMTLLTSKANRKNILIWTLLIFVLSNIVSAMATSYGVLFFARVFSAILHPVYFAVAFTSAGQLSAPDKKASATALVFSGITLGSVLGIPLMTFFADKFSLQTAFFVAGAINALASLLLLKYFPQIPAKEDVSHHEQIQILRRSPVWYSIGVALFVGAGMFATYSYLAQYLTEILRMDGTQLSIMLLVFGASGVLGNTLGARFLKYRQQTVMAYILGLSGIYVLLLMTSSTFWPATIICTIWGAIHGAGPLIIQNNLASQAEDFPEFANSLAVSFINLGIATGAAVGGWFLERSGIHSLFWCAFAFLILGAGCVFGIIYRPVINKPLEN